MDGGFFYGVKCMLPNTELADRWRAYMMVTHLPRVQAAGATLVAFCFIQEGLDPTAVVTFLAMYWFRDRSAYDTYCRDERPRLNQEMLGEFPQELGILYQRWGGTNML